MLSALLGTRRVTYVGPSTVNAGRMSKFPVSIMQLGMEFEDTAACWRAVDKMSQAVTSLRTIFDRENLTFDRSMEPMIGTFRKDASWKEACDEVYYDPDGIMSTKRLANICVSDKRLILNMNHALGDGGYFLHVVDMIVNDRKVPNEIPCLPVMGGSLYRSKVEALDENERWSLGETLTRIKSKKDVTELRHIKYEDVAEVKTLVEDVHKLQCYNKKTGKCSGLTDSLWAALVLCAEAWNGKMTKFGLHSCVDHRQRQLASLDPWTLGCCFTIISHSAPVNPNETIQSLGRHLRQDFVKRINSPAMYDFWRHRPSQPGDMHLELSHLGRMRIKRPVTDVWVMLKLPETVGYPNLALLSWAVENETRNTLTGHLRFSPAQFHPSEAEVMRDSIKFFLESLPATMTVADAFAAIRKYQESHRV